MRTMIQNLDSGLFVLEYAAAITNMRSYLFSLLTNRTEIMECIFYE